jgi:hypothetical protein
MERIIFKNLINEKKMISLILTSSAGLKIDYKIDSISAKEDNLSILDVIDQTPEGVAKPKFYVDYYTIASFVALAKEHNLSLQLYLHDTVVNLNSESYKVTFTVVDGSSTPITNATITLADVTNAAGDYEFQNVAVGVSQYTVSASGYSSTAGAVTVTNADVVENVTLS